MVDNDHLNHKINVVDNSSLINRIISTDSEVVSLVAEHAVAGVMRALDAAGLVRLDPVSQVYRVGVECTREQFEHYLRRELGR